MDELELQKVLAKLIFQSADDAAIHALNKVTEPQYEMGGVIYQDNRGMYSFSDPAGDKRTGKFKVEASIPKSATPKAIYHTHPGYGDAAALAESFSDDDIKVANQLKMMSYIRAMDSGNIKKYEPGHTPVTSVGTGLRRTKESLGDTIYAKVNE